MVSGHSGLQESVELRLFQEKYEQNKKKHDEQMKIVCGVLDKMTKEEQKRFICQLIKKYK